MTNEDWSCGPAGCAARPVPPFHFLKAEQGGSTPKMDVRDSKGRIWSVKFGGEVIPECFGSRFLTALGYFAESTYCVSDFKVVGVTGLPVIVSHQQRPDGSFARARFEIRGDKTMQFLPHCNWAWKDNPFLGSHELGGLKIVMMLLSNWDTKDAHYGDDSNNGVFLSNASGHPELLYSTFDWGASLGAWGGMMHRDQSDCVSFAADTPKFIEDPGGPALDWGYSGKDTKDITEGVDRDDIRWLLPYLERITPAQLETGFIGSGATPRQARCWTSSLEERIRQLQIAAH